MPSFLHTFPANYVHLHIMAICSWDAGNNIKRDILWLGRVIHCKFPLQLSIAHAFPAYFHCTLSFCNPSEHAHNCQYINLKPLDMIVVVCICTIWGIHSVHTAYTQAAFLRPGYEASSLACMKCTRYNFLKILHLCVNIMKLISTWRVLGQ